MSFCIYLFLLFFVPSSHLNCNHSFTPYSLFSALPHAHLCLLGHLSGDIWAAAATTAQEPCHFLHRRQKPSPALPRLYSEMRTLRPKVHQASLDGAWPLWKNQEGTPLIVSEAQERLLTTVQSVFCQSFRCLHASQWSPESHIHGSRVP